MALIFLMQRDGSRGAEALLHQHALQWRLARRRADEVVARTALMRLEPEVLFETLRRARSTFHIDAPRADATLEALTTYLRAVLQTSKASRATFGDEIDLAVARLSLSDFAERLGVTVGAAPQARARRVVAGVLPQLLFRWGKAVAAEAPASIALQIAASEVDGARLAVRFDAPAPPPDVVLDPVLQQLAVAAGKSTDDVVRFHGRGSFTLYFENTDDA